jgi:hypothetical protein
LKNAMYWGNLKKYKEIVKYPTNMIYVDWEGEVEKGIVLEKLGLDASMFDKNDL